MADAWATTSTLQDLPPPLGLSPESKTTGISTSQRADKSTQQAALPGPTILQRQHCLALQRQPIDAQFERSTGAPASTRRRTKRCAAPLLFDLSDPSASRISDTSGPDALSAVGEDVDTDALAEHFFAVIRAAEAGLRAIGFEEDVDSAAGDVEELDVSAADRASPVV